MIELGVGMFGDVQINSETGEVQDAGQRMQEILEEVKLMDQVGLDFFGIGEHHRKDYAVAAPEILLAAAASITKNITLGSAVSVISSADPVKLYQDFSMVDLLSDGRAEIMAGRGSFTESFPLFGNNMQDYDALFDEKLKLLLQLNEKEEITWQGKFRPALNKQTVYPQPKNGSIPIWVAVGGTPQSVLRAGKLGLPVMFAIIGGSLERFQPLVDYYRHVWKENGHAMEDFQVGVHMHALFGEKSEEIADWYYPYYSSQMDRIGQSRGWPAYQRTQYDYGRSKSGHLIIGDPEYAIDKILHAIELFGLTRFSAHMDVGSPDHKQMMKSIELFGDKIAPKVREALK